MSKKSYKEFREHYCEMLELFDTVHFASSVSEQVYKRDVKIEHSELLPITNSRVKDNRRERSYLSKELKLIFIGYANPYKGLPMLEDVLLELYSNGNRNWRLEIWGDTGISKCEAIEYRGHYKAEELEHIFCDDVLLIVPSLWNETFSLATLEAISFGVPTLVSSTVGAKDIVEQYDSWFIFKDRDDLKNKLLELINDKTRLCEFNKAILNNDWNHSLSAHAHKMMHLYTNN
ncbi:MAG: glycosyltransferase family 4 protein [Rikenellaceae bacterium]